MIQLQHTSKTSETIETHICNVGGERPRPVDSGRRGGSQRRAATREHHPAPAPIESPSLVLDN